MEPILVASPYLQDPNDFQPSSSGSNHFDINQGDSPYSDQYSDHYFESEYIHDDTFPHTPSYNGSYQNSPYPTLAGLPNIDNSDITDSLSLFGDNPSGITITTVGVDDYDPAQYDIPNGSLMSFDDSYMHRDSSNPQVAITPPAYDHSSPSAFDHASPASSAGGEDDHLSRSSNSSYMHPNSPPLDFQTNFESLHFESPSWPTARLPDRASPPAPKPHSPPQLLIPDISSPATTVHDEPPTINAPDGDGGMPSGPQLHIVPATPVSGGAGTTQTVPFLQQGGPQELGPSSWDQPQHLVSQPVNQTLAASNQSQGYYTGSHPSSPGMAFTNPPLPSNASPSPERSRQQHQYLAPQVPLARSRSLSDTSLRPPIWDTPMSTAPSGVSTVNMHDVLPAPGSSSPSPSPIPSQRLPSSAGPHQTSFNNMSPPQPRLPQHFSFGPPDGNPSGMQRMSHNDFLSPDFGATPLRRAKSDGMRTAGFGHRQSRSEDIRFSTSLAATTANSTSMYPPLGGMTRDFMNQASFLHPTQSIIPSISNGRGHRRSSSGSPQRPLGWSSGTSSARASPYPSPSASPRPGYPALPGGDMGPTARRGMGMDMGVMGGGLMDNGLDMNLGATGEIINVAKVNVTTPSTADASQKRRKQPANFKCPVPGCGSTFTRHFNLKGHLRSHKEEKPYQCKWPGCGKGFARQHDCKRHEALHLNIRPYRCEGCKKNFARMDALNRHLRSEGGAECRKIQKEVRPTGDEVEEGSPGLQTLDLKPDPDANWGTNGGLVM